MDKKEIAEVKKLFRKNHCALDRIVGCFAGENGEIIARSDDAFMSLPEEEEEKYLELMKKALSGRINRNLFNLEFPLQEENVGGKQTVMYHLLQSALGDSGLIEEFTKNILANLDSAGRHLIILAHGNYDIPKKTSDGEMNEDASDYVYQFLICCICPVGEIKEGLCFDAANMTFVNKKSDLGVQMPMLGFLYPAFNDRMPDIHSALYYAKKEDERHPELIEVLFGSDMPITESAQKELFTDLIEQTLGRDCTFDNVKNVTDSIGEMVKEEEKKGGDEPVELGCEDVRRIAVQSGASDENLEDFSEKFDSAVGEGGTFHADSLQGIAKSFRIQSPSVSISVKDEMKDMITTRVIDGREYILIPLQEDTEVNGIRILAKRQETENEE